MSNHELLPSRGPAGRQHIQLSHVLRLRVVPRSSSSAVLQQASHSRSANHPHLAVFHLSRFHNYLSADVIDVHNQKELPYQKNSGFYRHIVASQRHVECHGPRCHHTQDPIRKKI